MLKLMLDVRSTFISFVPMPRPDVSFCPLFGCERVPTRKTLENFMTLVTVINPHFLDLSPLGGYLDFEAGRISLGSIVKNGARTRGCSGALTNRYTNAGVVCKDVTFLCG
jgi:hypothetical protein